MEDEVGVNVVKKSLFSLFTPGLQKLAAATALPLFAAAVPLRLGGNGLAAAHTNHRQSRRRVPRVEQTHGV